MDVDAIDQLFPDEDTCLTFLEEVRWKGRPLCPYCGVCSSSPMPKERRHHCNNCSTSFSVTVRTLFQKTQVDLRVWMAALLIVTAPGQKVSVRSLAEKLDVNRNTARFMIMRIQLALVQEGEFVEQILRRILAADHNGRQR